MQFLNYTLYSIFTFESNTKKKIRTDTKILFNAYDFMKFYIRCITNNRM